jgi:hypothetical protein
VAAPLEQQKDFAANYGWALAVLRSAPELSKLFDRAIAGGFNQARFVAELRNTKWYRSRAESVRQGEVLRKADPAEYARRIKQAAAMVADQYYAMTGRRMGGPTAAHLGQSAFLYGFNDAEVRDMVANTVSSAKLMKGGIGGTLGEAERQLRQAADDYGIDPSSTWFLNTINNIAWQNTDVSAEISKLRQLAKSKYAAFADRLDKGETMKEIVEPYRQVMAKTLEISDQGIRIADKQIQAALMYAPKTAAEGANNSGNKPTAPVGMPLWQFEQQLKNDPRWNKTKGAQDASMAAARQVLQDLGFQGSN